MSNESNTSNPTPAVASTLPSIVPITAHHHLPIKLTLSNFPSWRAHLIALLRGHNLLGYIDGTFNRPPLLPDGSNAEAVTHWIRQDQLLLAAMFGSLSAEVLPVVSLKETSCDAWNALTRLCAGKSRSRVNQLKSEL